MEIKKAVRELQQELLELRRDFHRHPELGYEEYRTSQRVAEYLQACGLEVKTLAKTGVAGLLRGREPGPTVLLRADLDALPLTEQTEAPYKSVYPGKMHACGHDGHTAILLVAARILAGMRQQFKGNVKFVFQPNEESAGAQEMIRQGVLEDPKVDGAFGLHLWTPLASGQIGVAPGPIMAASEEFALTIIGKAGHTSAPHTALDPIMVAAAVVQNLQTIQTREVNSLTPTVIMVGKIEGGTGRNIIPEQVRLEGTIRYLYENEAEEKPKLLAKITRLIQHTCQAMGAQYELQFIPSNPVLKNDARLVEMVRQAVQDTLGGKETIVPYVCMAGDDFAEFTQRVPSAYFFVGTGNAAKGSHYPHHHPQFNIDEDTLATGVELQVRSALRFLRK